MLQFGASLTYATSSVNYDHNMFIIQATVLQIYFDRHVMIVMSDTCGLYYKPMTIINEDSRIITKLETSLTDDARVIIYDSQMFIVQATVL
jgi:hypothetical protein